MDRAIIFGTFEFLGFHFCSSLLERGYEVEGIHFDHSGDTQLLNNMRMEIGRNANFKEVNDQSRLSLVDISEETLIIIDYYDFYVKNKLKSLEENNIFVEFLNNNTINIKETNSKMVLLLPAQFVSSTTRMASTDILQNENYSHLFYLPTIYGPWQSETFIFQQTLIKNFLAERKLCLSEREWVHDALYVDDVVDSILTIAEKESTVSYLLKSEMNDHWQKCADYLSIPLAELDYYERNNSQEHSKVHVKMIKNHLQFTEAIDKQKRHTMLLFQG